jgi:hypothetical protein
MLRDDGMSLEQVEVSRLLYPGVDVHFGEWLGLRCHVGSSSVSDCGILE